MPRVPVSKMWLFSMASPHHHSSYTLEIEIAIIVIIVVRGRMKRGKSNAHRQQNTTHIINACMPMLHAIQPTYSTISE